MGVLENVKLHFVESMCDANEFMSWLGERRTVLGVDTETTGLRPWCDHVRLVQFGDHDQGWTFRWDRWGGLVQEIFRDYTGDYVFHNAKFDLMMLKQWCEIELEPSRVHDTLIMSKVLDATGVHGLKPLSERLIDPQAGLGQRMLDKAFKEGGWDWDKVPYHVPAYSMYAAMDTVLTVHLFDILYPQVVTRCLPAYNLEREFSSVVQKIEMRGSKVDRDYTMQSATSLNAFMTDTEQWCIDTYGVKPGASQAVITRLQEDGISFIKTTAGGALQLNKDVLEDIDHPLAKAVLLRRQAQKTSGTYLKNFIEMSDDDMIIRPNMNTQGTVTGRMTMELFQTLPRRSDDNPMANIVRNCIIPREGNIIMLCDWDQIEMRILAHFSQDPGLAKAFTEGDFFLNIVREIFADNTIARSDPRRQTTKNAMYGKVYGAGIEKFSTTAGISIEAGTKFMEQLDTRFPGMNTLKHQVERIAKQRQTAEGRPYVTNPFTQQPYFIKREDKIYALVNYLIQGTAASILKMKVVELDNAGLGDYITLLVHDEVIADVPRDVAKDVASTVKNIMNDASLLTVPVTASLNLGSRWGQKGDIRLEDL